MLTLIKNNFNHYFVDENNCKQGEYVAKWGNNNIAYRCFYLNNERHGKFESWTIDCGKWEQSFYVNGVQHGEYKKWDKDGNITEHCFCISGKKISFDTIPYPETNEELMIFKLKYDLQLLPVEKTC